MPIKIMALIRNASQSLSSALIGIDIGINARIFIGIDRHWALVEGVLSNKHLKSFPNTTFVVLVVNIKCVGCANKLFTFPACHLNVSSLKKVHNIVYIRKQQGSMLFKHIPVTCRNINWRGTTRDISA